MLCMQPLVGALAAGNCCMVKPSAYSPATSAVIKRILEEIFDPEYVTVVEGGHQENQALLEQRFDYIFFTGGVTVGKQVMEKAARHLAPVTLELEGKSPCIITDSCVLKVAAKRVVFGKYLNCGQTCVAPDYCLVDAKHFERILELIDPQKVILGGTSNAETLQIAPTILDNVTATDAVMQEEIFGPILPIITYETIKEAEHFIKQYEKPLALYLFTKNTHLEKRFMSHVSFGGGCVNDTIVHLSESSMGFGGVGHNGMGTYHGKKSFETFSHQKYILKKYNWIDLPCVINPIKH